MAYTDNFPQRPVFMADFANGGRIDPRATFTRASTANVWDGSKHLSSENLVLNSEALSGWDRASLTPTADAGTAPDGSTTADSFIVNTTGIYPWIWDDTAGTTDHTGDIVFSVYAKANGWRWIQLFFNNANQTVWFDLQNGVVGTEAAGSTGTMTAVGSTGWYRCSIHRSGTNRIKGAVAMVDGDNTKTGTAHSTNAALFWGAQLTTGYSTPTAYNATTTQIHRAYAPSLVSKANNVGRFDHTADGQSMGILIEGQAQNLIERSDSIDNAYWVKTNVSVTASAAVGVTGALNACLVTESADSVPTNHNFFSNFVYPTSASSCTVSLYCKSAGVPRVKIFTTVGGNGRYVIYDIVNGTVLAENNGGTGTVESVGNGFYRISMTYTAPTTGGGRVYLTLLDASSNDTYTGNGYNGVITSGWQFEMGSHCSSLISTSGSAVTRAAESLSVATADIGYTGGPVTGIVDAVNIGAANYPTFAALADSTGSQRVTVQGDATSTNATTQVLTDGTLVAYVTRPLTIAASTVGFRIDTDNYACVVNGGSVSTDTSGAIPSSFSTLHIGQNHVSQYQVNGNIKRIALYNEALSDTNLQALTS